MRRTPQFKIPFFQQGNIYSGALDKERSVVIDNQLFDLSKIVGDGILDGLQISSVSGLNIEVSKGSSFISALLHKTLSDKQATLIDNAQNYIYLQSLLTSSTDYLNLEIEGSFSEVETITYVDTIPPAAPTGFVATQISSTEIDLTWNVNPEIDFSNYQITRSLSSGGTFTLIATVQTNGTALSPFQDTALSPATHYYYKIYAVDKTGKLSTAATYDVSTSADTSIPSDPINLRLFVGNNQLSVVFDPSSSQNIASYVITLEQLDTNGNIVFSSDTNIGLLQTAQFNVSSNTEYIVIVKSKNTSGNLSLGIQKGIFITSNTTPYDISGLMATPASGGINLVWTASQSQTGLGISQKNSYQITIFNNGLESDPINVGLSTSYEVKNYIKTLTNSVINQPLVENTVYLIKVITLDAFGNQSAGAFVKSKILNTTLPLNPRNVKTFPFDSEIVLNWDLSLSINVQGYNIEIDTGSGYGTPIQIANLNSYTASATNGVLTHFRIKTRDIYGNPSIGVIISDTALLDTTPPSIPIVNASSEDGQIFLNWDQNTATDFDHFILTRQEILEDVNYISPNKNPTVLSHAFFNLGTATSFTDIGKKFEGCQPPDTHCGTDIPITNGSNYTYTVASVDSRGNQSNNSIIILISPSEGINTGANKILAPYSVIPTLVSSSHIHLTWSFDFPGSSFDNSLGWLYPDDGPTNFNIYRSTNRYYGYTLIDSVTSNLKQYDDYDVIGGTQYYYLITAVKDNTVVIANTSSTLPPNSILLGSAKTSGGSIFSQSLINAQRITSGLSGTIQENINSLILLHKHSASPTNITTITALNALVLIDVSTLTTTILSALTLNSASKKYYQNMIVNPITGVTNVFPINTKYIIDPSIIVGNMPLINNFQLMIDGTPVNVKFNINNDDNSVNFSSGLITNTNIVSLDGLGLNYYVPFEVTEPTLGFDVLIDGVKTSNATFDSNLQTIGFLTPIVSTSVISMDFEPLSPNFGTNNNPRQINLAGNTIIDDFTTTTQTVYTSASGDFQQSDSIVLLVNGQRTALDYYIDFTLKAVVFTVPLDPTFTVSLLIQGRAEVQNTLNTNKFTNLDASQIASGELLKSQILPISHNGRIKEFANPIFNQITTLDGYKYSVPVNILGPGITPYSYVYIDSNNSYIGTSAGFSRSVKPGLFVTSKDTVSIQSNSVSNLFIGTDVFDSPIKQFFNDVLGNTLAITGSNIYSTNIANNGLYWTQMSGLEFVSTIHSVSQGFNNTLYAATDLGVYEIYQEIHNQGKWFQAGLIGAGSTECFDLQSYNNSMLVGTEIGLYQTFNDGNTWTLLFNIENVTAIEVFGTYIYIISNQDVYRSSDGGTTWINIGTFSFIDQNSKMISRSPLDIFISSNVGLYYSQDGLNFNLLNLDRNKNERMNNVIFLSLFGADIIVGYDDTIYSVDPSYLINIINQYSGSYPTIKVNGNVIKNGYEFDSINNNIIFDNKTFSDDIVTITSNYFSYIVQNGGWYQQNTDCPITIYVNDAIVDSGATMDARTGKIAFTNQLTKYDIVKCSIYYTTLKNAGELFHNELEDGLSKSVSLPLSLGRDLACNILELAISGEHNFIDTNNQSIFNKMINTDTYVLGKNSFDDFNSSINYLLEDSQEDIGFNPNNITCVFEKNSTEVWVGTDAGIFILDQTNNFSIKSSFTVGDISNSIRQFIKYNNEIYCISKYGLYQLTTSLVVNVTKVQTNGLSNNLYSINQIGNILLIGTDNGGIYYQDNENLLISNWILADFVDSDNITELRPIGIFNNIVSDGNGFYVASSGSDLFVTLNGKNWKRVYSFINQDLSINNITKIVFFASKLYCGTFSGLLSDNGSIRTNAVNFGIEMVLPTLLSSQELHINDLYSTNTDLYMVSESNAVFDLSSGVWNSSDTISSVESLINVFKTSLGTKLTTSLNQIFSE